MAFLARLHCACAFYFDLCRQNPIHTVTATQVFRQEWVTLDPMKVFTWRPAATAYYHVNTFIGSNVTHS